MPIGIVSDSEFEKELDNSLVEVNRDGVPSVGRGKEPVIDNGDVIDVVTGEVLRIERGRGENNNEVPESLRAVIGETVILEGRQAGLELAKSFGVSDSSVSAYTSGKTSTSSPVPEKKLKNHLELIRKNATKRAGRKLLAALDHITDEKMAEAPAGVLAGMAKCLSGVIRDMEPEVIQNNNESGVKFVVFAPQLVQENKFEVVTVQE